jgi:1-acyl-sn-glycerol-3-phosphate acyltransferase
VFGNSESRSRRGEEADDLSKFHNPDPPPHLGGCIFQTGSQSEATRANAAHRTQSQILVQTLASNPGRVFVRGCWLLAEFARAALVYPFWILLRGSETRRRAQARWLQQACSRLLHVLGIKAQVFGSIPGRGLLVCNHLSYLDILVLAATTPSAFVAKREVRSWLVFGWFARMAGTVFVRRQAHRDLLRVNQEIGRALKENVLLVLFPEGTSSDGQTVLPFKSSLLAPVVEHLPPVLAGFIGYDLDDGSVAEEVCYWRDMTLVPHLVNLLGKAGITARVAVVPHRFNGEDGRLRKDLARQLRLEVLGLKKVFEFPGEPQCVSG